MKTDTPRVIRLSEYAPYPFTVESLDLAFDLDPKATRVESTLKLSRTGDSGAALELDGEDLRLVSVAIDGEALAEDRYEATDSGLRIAKVPDAFTLTITTEIAPEDNTKLEGLYLSNGMYCTQCEAEGFRRITYFPDRPDVMTTYRVTIRADKGVNPVLLSNGNRVDAGDLDGGRHYVTWEDPFKKPSYLFALVAGDLARVQDSFRTRSGRDVELNIWVEHGNESRCPFAMESLKKAMKWDEDVYGLEYDLNLFNIVAVSHFNMGAMENKSLNVFNAKAVLADPETATDADYAYIEAVVAHEYFHNWTGNRITCRDWFQLSLKEGLTVFRDQQFSSDMRSAPVERIDQVRSLRARQFPEDAGPLAHPVRPDSYIEINNFYTATVYMKGAEVIRMMHRLLGEDGFRKGMDLYIARHDGTATTCDNFAKAMEDASGRDLSQFKRWYSQAGTPQVEAEGRFEDGVYALTIRQHTDPTPGQDTKHPQHIPFEVGLISRDGAALPLRLEGEPADGEAPLTRVLDVTEAEQTFRFTGLEAEPVPSLNRGFTAPVRLTAPWSDADRALLMRYDPDSFAKWEAGQQYATQLLLNAVNERAAGRNVAPDATRFVDALGTTLSDETLDPAYRAQMMALPTEDYLAEQMPVMDVDGVHAAREALKRDIAVTHADLFTKLRDQHRAAAGPFAPTAEGAGHRALANGALAYLTTDPANAHLAAEQYDAADNMTDRMAALRVLVELDVPERDRCLTDFHDRYQHNELALDKWFSVQAVAARPDTLARVKDLMSHEKFTMRNPNRVRALVGAFAMGNPTVFHAKDGSGYAFLADRVLELNSLNPQIGARLLQPLGRWKRMDEDRRKLMTAELDRILAAPDLARDIYEIASKSRQA
ncbi:Membrane alanine aminopeptidase N [Caenispirillum salinarum AK4]|uniref:Aminopeptidase N n=1 Tax=Caenispirillum salinarum AK4 TaxID=1238182 RepID=K9HSN2_9PROT|nr:aminopeptidase N [Caenispirillum salinarum]EKV31341.1 Membrane alanine aminopeptidase N [Caenispirillum salinarum AK4]